MKIRVWKPTLRSSNLRALLGMKGNPDWHRGEVITFHTDHALPRNRIGYAWIGPDRVIVRHRGCRHSFTIPNGADDLLDRIERHLDF